MKNLSLITCLLVLSFFSCKKEETILAIDPAFEEYVDRFYMEADLRDIKLVKENLEVVFKEIEDFCGLGYANYRNTGLRRVEINSNRGCWEGRTDLEKENLMFHELGHAVLGRPHVDFFLPNGSSKSIMCSSDFCNAQEYNKYTLATRPYYVTELFDVNTPTPEWGREKTKETLIFQDDFSELDTNWIFFVAGEVERSNFSSELVNDEDNGFANVVSNEKPSINVLTGWRYQLVNPIFLKEGGTLRLKVSISASDLAGKGAALVLRTDSGINGENEISSSSTTKNKIFIFGDIENSDYTTQIGYYPTDVTSIYIALVMLGDTKGEVQFNKIELTYLE